MPKQTTPASLTSLPVAPDLERRIRMRRYTLMMSIRTLCVIAAAFSSGWWILVFALGAVFLPYVAVLVANQKSDGNAVRPAAGLSRALPSAGFDTPGKPI